MTSSHHSLSGKGERDLEHEHEHELLLLMLHGEQLCDDLQLDSESLSTHMTCTLGFLSAHSFTSLCFLFPSCLLLSCFSHFLLCSSLLQWLCEECLHLSLDWGFYSSCLLLLREQPHPSGLWSDSLLLFLCLQLSTGHCQVIVHALEFCFP